MISIQTIAVGSLLFFASSNKMLGCSSQDQQLTFNREGLLNGTMIPNVFVMGEQGELVCPNEGTDCANTSMGQLTTMQTDALNDFYEAWENQDLDDFYSTTSFSSIFPDMEAQHESILRDLQSTF